MHREQAHVSRGPRHNQRNRRGNILVMSALLMILLMGMVAFSVDVGYMALTKTEIQTSTDAAALAGAGELVNGTEAAQAAALTYLAANKAGGHTLSETNASFEFGTWNNSTHEFTVTNETPNAIHLTTSLTQQPLFFGRVLGRNTFNTGADSIATYQPREIGLVLDYSGSMAYDSTFRNISLIGQAAVEANLQQIYTRAGASKHGQKPLKTRDLRQFTICDSRIGFIT